MQIPITNYAEACAAFDALGDYSDSKERLKESLYHQAVWLLEQGEDAAAYDSFLYAEDYKDAKEMLSKFQPIVISEEYTYGDNQGYTTYYEYTADGKLAKAWVEDSNATEYSYSSEGILVQTKRLNYWKLVNNVPTYYLTDFDEKGSPVRIEDNDENDLWEFVYEYAEDGSVLSLTCTYTKKYKDPITKVLDFAGREGIFYVDSDSNAGALYLNAFLSDRTYVRYAVYFHYNTVDIYEVGGGELDEYGNLIKKIEKGAIFSSNGGWTNEYQYTNTCNDIGNLLEAVRVNVDSGAEERYRYNYGYIYCTDAK